jgi:hypothetical protein
MPTVRDLTPGDAEELTALYEEYEWWADREVADVREALAATEVAVGVEDDGALVAPALRSLSNSLTPWYMPARVIRAQALQSTEWTSTCRVGRQSRFSALATSSRPNTTSSAR